MFIFWFFIYKNFISLKLLYFIFFNRFSQHGGFSLVIDYGHDGSRQTNSLRAYKNHQLVDPLDSLGQIDLTADINFGYIKQILSDKCLIFGPVEQRYIYSNFYQISHLKKGIQIFPSILSKGRESSLQFLSPLYHSSYTLLIFKRNIKKKFLRGTDTYFLKLQNNKSSSSRCFF